MSAKPDQKTAVLICCFPSHEVVDALIKVLRGRNYHVALLITSPLGFNWAMEGNLITAMAKTIGDVTNKVWDPPPILSVVNTKQCEDIYCSINPDFTLCLGFAYPISKKMLSMKAKILNLHPGKFPIERGSFPGLWPTLYPEKYSMDDLVATFHYMNENIDCGPIVKEIPLKTAYPEGTTLLNRPPGLVEFGIGVLLQHVDEVIGMVEQGAVGQPQVQPETAPQLTEGKGYGAREPTEEERTLQPTWSKEKALTLIRALKEGDYLIMPYFFYKGRRYWVERAEEWSWPGKTEPKVGDVMRVGFDHVVMFDGGAIRLATRTR